MKPRNKVAQLHKGLLVKIGFGGPPEPDTEREWQARPTLQPLVAACMAIICSAALALNPGAIFIRLLFSILLGISLVDLILGVTTLLTLATRVVLHRNGTLTFVGPRRRLDVVPGQLRSVSTRTGILHRGWGWRVSTEHRSIWVASKIQGIDEVARAIAVHSPDARVSRAFLSASSS